MNALRRIPGLAPWPLLIDLVWQLDDKLPTLEEQGMPKLGAESASQDEQGKEGKHQDRAFELKRLAKSLLLNFLELLGILSIDPAQVRLKPSPARFVLSSSYEY